MSLFACRGCLLVRQSFFHNNPSNFVDLSGGVVGCRGFHSSFRVTQSGLSLNFGLLYTLGVYQLCSLLPLQRYTKALSTLQRSSLVEKSRQKPQERMDVLSDKSFFVWIKPSNFFFLLLYITITIGPSKLGYW